MKKILFILIGICSISYSQIDRTKVPEAGKAPVIEIGEYQEFKLKNGLHVILVENHKLPIISFQLSSEYVPFLEGDKTGMSDFVASMIGSGTETNTKAQLDEALDYIGASFFSSGIDGFYASSLKKHQNKLLELVSDIIFNPNFPQKEFEKVKKQIISALESQKSDPNAISSNMVSLINFGLEHPYGELTTKETIGNINVEDLKNLYNTYFKPNISYLVIVGDMDIKEAKKVAKKYFKKWKYGEVPKKDLKKYNNPSGTQVHFSHKEGAAQSVIKLTYPLNLKPNNKNIIASKVMNSILGGSFSGRLNLNLREDKAFTYGARSSTSADNFVGSFSATASVRNEVTDSAVTEFIYELNNIKTDLVKTEEIELAKNYMTGTFSISLENPKMAGKLALNTKINKLDENYYKNYLKNLNNVTKKDILEFASKYIDSKNCNIVIVGDKEIAQKLQKFDSDGSITYYDANYKIIDGIKKEIPEGITAEVVIQKNIEVCGGEQNMNNWDDVTIKYEIEISGAPMKVSLETNFKKPNMFYMSLSMKMGELMGMKYNGEKCIQSGMQGKKELSKEEIEKERENFYLYPILYIKDLNHTFQLKEIEEVNGKDAYKIIRTDKWGLSKTIYFDINNGHIIKEVFQKDGMENIIEFSDYENHEGLIIPKNMSITVNTPQGSQVMKGVIKDVIKNSGLKSKKFN